MTIAPHTLIAERTAEAVWEGPLSRGHGTVRSGIELAVAAHASRFSMALALRRGEHDVAPERLDVAAAVPPGEVDGRPTVGSSALSVLSRLSAGVEITLDATLDRSRDS